MSIRIITGEFDAEKRWEDGDSVTLPSVSSAYYDRVVEAMDELMIAYDKNPDDILITKNPLNSFYREYLEDYGIKCRNFTYEQFETSFKMEGNGVLDTYAVTEKHIDFAQKHNMQYNHPMVEIIRKVNSKFFSVQMSKHLGINDYSYLVYDVSELKNQLEKLLKKHEKVMVKTEYGVSGKGNMVVDPKRLNRFLSLTVRQTEKGKRVRYIVEPFFSVKNDFSSQWNISEAGEIRFDSIQEILNNGSSYGGSADVSEKIVEFLKREGYFVKMEQVCKKLYKEGYFGEVCVDSMILEDGRLIPVVEINARKSMSLTKFRLDQLLKTQGYRNQVSCMFSKDIAYQSNLNFQELTEIFYECGIGYEKQCRCGIIPVTCNTLFTNRDLSRQQSKGKLYCYATASDRNLLEDLVAHLNSIKVFTKNGEL